MQNRRNFLKKAALGFGSLQLGLPILDTITQLTSVNGARLVREACAGGGPLTGKRRRHLINLGGGGGWDSSLFHNGVSVQAYQAAMGKNVNALFQSDITTGLATFGSLMRDTPGHFCLSNRCDDAKGFTYTAPNGTSHFFPGYFSAAIKAAQVPGGDSVDPLSFLKDSLLIWKGLRKEGEHGVGNFAVNQGTSAAYAKSFASIVAKGIADQDYSRQLHHVAVSSSAAALSINTNMTSGFESPTVIADQATFAALTSNAVTLMYSLGGVKPGTSASAPMQSIQQIVNNAVAALSTQVLKPEVKFKSSAQAVDTFTGNYGNSMSLSSSGYATCGEFLGLKLMYGLAALRGLGNCADTQSIVGSQNADQSLAALGYSTSAVQYYLDRLTPFYQLIQKDLTTLIKKSPSTPLAELQKADAAILTAFSTAAVADANYPFMTTFLPMFLTSFDLEGPVFSFALTDFLIRNDLTAVTNLSFLCTDPHYQWSRMGLFALSKSYAMTSQLITNLSIAQTATGQSLLDCTLIVMQTEMDRWPFLEGGQGGTNHGPSASVIMAGYGIKRGAVIGDIAWNPGADYSAYKTNSAHDATPTCFTGLPIDPVSGAPSPTGKLQSVASILPTICAIFEIQVPGDQIGSYGACRALLSKV